MTFEHNHKHAGHNHAEQPIGSAAAGSQRSLLIVLGLTGSYMLAEVVGGLLTNSLALLADAGHMLTDVLGLAMALAAIRFAQRKATAAKTFGFYRTEILAALANSLVLMAIAAYIFYEAWQRFQSPPEIESLPMILVATGGLAVNIVGAKLLHSHAGESLNAQGAFLHILGDLLGSIAVIVGGVVIFFTGWTVADPIVSVLLSFLILPQTLQLLKSALDVLLEGAPAHINVARVQATMQQVPGVVSIHDLHVWTITSGFVALSAHVASNHRRPSDVMHDVQVVLRDEFDIQHATLQVEPADHVGDGACCNVDPRCLVVGSRFPISAEEEGNLTEGKRVG